MQSLFLKMLSIGVVMHSVATVGVNPALNGVLFSCHDGVLNLYWEFNESYLRLVAADGFRLGYIDTEIDNSNEFSFLLNLKTMRELPKILSAYSDTYFTLVFDTLGCKEGNKMTFVWIFLGGLLGAAVSALLFAASDTVYNELLKERKNNQQLAEKIAELQKELLYYKAVADKFSSIFKDRVV